MRANPGNGQVACGGGWTVERAIARCADVSLHYRCAGAPGERALVLFHPSPKSSAMYEGWMRELAAHFRVYALDTPGYGSSDPLVTPPRSLDDYLGPIFAWMDQVVGASAMIYGSATGAQLGIALARRAPGRVQHLLLDNAAHFDEEERARILAQYFPDLSPQEGGAHLLAAWRMARGMAQYFPWFSQDEAHRFATGSPNAQEIHATALELLAAGPGYWAAYRAAFEHERADHVRELKVPTTLFRWLGSPILRHVDRLLGFDLPPQIRVVETPAPMPERYAAMSARLRAVRMSLALAAQG